ncbi:MAG: hypothetical protein ACRD6W_07435 [Nitrososphaerales archaeon]
MTLGIDFTSRVRADLVGLEEQAGEELTDILMTWVEDGSPRENRRQLGGIEFFEAIIAQRYLLGYIVRDDPPGVLLIWLRRRPGWAE